MTERERQMEEIVANMDAAFARMQSAYSLMKTTYFYMMAACFLAGCIVGQLLTQWRYGL